MRKRGRSLFYGTDRNGTEQFRHIILRNGTGSNAHTTAKYIAIKLPTVVLAFPVSKGRPVGRAGGGGGGGVRGVRP